MAKARFDRSTRRASAQLVHARRDEAGGSAEHAHEQLMLFVPLSGALAFVVGGKRYIADAQHALAIRAGTPHRHEAGGAVEYFIAYVDDAGLGDLPAAFRFANTALVRELAAELVAERDDETTDAAVTLLRAVAKQRRKLHADAPPPDDERLAKAIALARERYRDGVTSARLAKAAGMSTRTFERALTRAMGTSPRQLVEDLRLAEARTRLEAGRETVTAVAFDLGYKSLSHFVRRFRRAFGVTPTAVTRSG